MDRVIQLNPQALFIIRFYAQLPDDTDDIVLLNLTDNGRVSLRNVSGTGPGMMNSLSEAWQAAAVSKFKMMLRYLDREYPGRIVPSLFIIIINENTQRRTAVSIVSKNNSPGVNANVAWSR
jgi:hypothetical protein